MSEFLEKIERREIKLPNRCNICKGWCGINNPCIDCANSGFEVVRQRILAGWKPDEDDFIDKTARPSN